MIYLISEQKLNTSNYPKQELIMGTLYELLTMI
jgi:hypothetical protein